MGSMVTHIWVEVSLIGYRIDGRLDGGELLELGAKRCMLWGDGDPQLRATMDQNLHALNGIGVQNGLDKKKNGTLRVRAQTRSNATP
jgi:hypothetical protein